jgi:acetyltransferase
LERTNPLDAVFAPRAVAVVGATEREGSVGRAILRNLACFGGRVYPVNPKRDTVLGIKAIPSVGAVPERIDLAIVVTPATTVAGVIRECAAVKIPAAVVISAGFKECGAEGAAREQDVLAEARRGGMRILGPNCLGVMAPRAGLNATFAAAMARPGNVAFLSQSGALCTAVLDWSLREKVGFSAFVSVGSMADIGWGDLIDYFGADPLTKSILIYMESAGDARSFLSAARDAAWNKPIVLLKTGRSKAAAEAAASHTGSMAGSDEVLDAACHRAGVLRVRTIEELFDMAEVLGKQPRPRGPRLAIVTNAGGPGALATDMLETSGGHIAKLTPETDAALAALLPPEGSRRNPIDILGDATPEMYGKAVELAARDANTDGVLVILTPQAMTDAAGTAERLRPLAKIDGKPILASWMGGAAVEPGEAILNDAGIPTFKYPDRAARAFELMWRHSENLRIMYETPIFVHEPATRPGAKGESPEAIIAAARKEGRKILTESESKLIMAAYGIPVVATGVAASEKEAVELAERFGYPVVLKLYSKTVTHKTDVGGVKLNLANAAAVRKAWKAIQKSVTEKAGIEAFQGVTVQPMVKLSGVELILGSAIDPQFGPVILFGAGGQLVEVLKDRALGLPPLNGTLARRLMEQTRIYEALLGVRGNKSADMAALEQILSRFSQLVVEQSEIAEIDINPLLASPDGLIALDARIALRPEDAGGAKPPRPAIRPYPTQYITSCKLKDGTEVGVRPIRPEDEPLIVRFHHQLSEQSVYFRFFGPLRLENRVAHERLARLCFIDYDRELALVATLASGEIIAVGRLCKRRWANDAEFAIVVADRWQRQGLGARLMELLIQAGRDEGLDRLTAVILRDNHGMEAVCRKAGCKVHTVQGQTELNAEIDL